MDNAFAYFSKFLFRFALFFDVIKILQRADAADYRDISTYILCTIIYFLVPKWSGEKKKGCIYSLLWFFMHFLCMCVGVFVNVVGFYSLLIVFTALPTNITKNGCKNNKEQKGPVAANITKKWTTLSWQTWTIHMWVNKLPTHRGLKCMANERIKSAKKNLHVN